MSGTGKSKGHVTGNAPRQRRLGNQAIGERLRQMYEGVVDESVPEEFLRLLDEAVENERGEADGKDGAQ